MPDQRKLASLAAMNDEDLLNAVQKAARAAGLPDSEAAVLLADASRVRAMLSALSPAKIETVLSRLDADKAAALRGSLGL